MENDPGEKHPPAAGVTAEGIVEAIEQDVELSIEQAKGAAKEAVATVKEKLGVGKPRARKPPAKKTKPPAVVVAKKAASKAIKSSKVSKVGKASKPSKEKKRNR
jgi:hypothetical protein